MAEKDKRASKLDKPMTREEALENALQNIEKAHGKGAIMRLGEAKANMNVEVISTGILPLDIALGVGGIPRGRIIEVFGPESSGKTTVTLHMIAEAQKAGGIAAFIDAEHALDPEYARKPGVNIEELLISQPDTGRHLKSWMRSCTVPRLTSLSWTRSQLSCRSPKLRAIWAPLWSVCRRDS